MHHLDLVERDLDLAAQQPAGIMYLRQAVQPAEGQPEAAASGREQAVGAAATEIRISGKKRKRQFCNHYLCQEVAKLMNEYSADFGTSKDSSAKSRAILPKLTAKWETISNNVQ